MQGKLRSIVALVAAGSAGVLAVGASTLAGASAANAAVPPSATAAATWLEAQLAANGHAMPGFRTRQLRTWV